MREMRKRMSKRRGRGGRKGGGRRRRKRKRMSRRKRWRWRKIEYFGVSDVCAEIDDRFAHGQRADDARVMKEGGGRRRGRGRRRG